MKLIISRKDEFRDYLRSYKIILDNNYHGIIKPGEVKELEIAPGNHTIHLKIDWCRSNKVSFCVSNDETIEFQCGSSIYGWRFILSLLYITFWKNKYLWIKKVS